MKKKSINIAIVISIIIIITLMTVLIVNKISNDNKPVINNFLEKEFVLDTEFKYIVRIKSNIANVTEYATIAIEEEYYQIDLENNTIELRKDYLPTEEYYNYIKNYSTYNYNFYTGKLINKKELTNKEKNELKELLDKVIESGNKNYNNREMITYYIIENEVECDIVMNDEDDIEIFKKIINI